MGGRGRTPRPTHIRALEGVKEYRLNRNEPVPSQGHVVPPVELPADAQAVWDRLAPDMIAKRVLTGWDVDEFTNACRIQALLNQALLEAEASPLIANGSDDNLVMNPAVRIVTSLQASLRSIWSRFGLSPADRATLRIDHSGPTSGDEGYVS
jgi:P27 family predicted phage terminase small subunit